MKVQNPAIKNPRKYRKYTIELHSEFRELTPVDHRRDAVCVQEYTQVL